MYLLCTRRLSRRSVRGKRGYPSSPCDSDSHILRLRPLRYQSSRASARPSLPRPVWGVHVRICGHSPLLGEWFAIRNGNAPLAGNKRLSQVLPGYIIATYIQTHYLRAHAIHTTPCRQLSASTRNRQTNGSPRLIPVYVACSLPQPTCRRRGKLLLVGGVMPISLLVTAGPAFAASHHPRLIGFSLRLHPCIYIFLPEPGLGA